MQYHRYFSTSVVLTLLGGCLLFLIAGCGSNSNTGGDENIHLTTTPTEPLPLTLTFKCRDNPAGGFYVNRSNAQVCVQTAPGAALTITVKFCNGAADPSSELKGTVYANNQGYYEWSWKPQPDCKSAHIWKGDVVVMAKLHGQSKSFMTSFFGD